MFDLLKASIGYILLVLSLFVLCIILIAPWERN